MRHPPGLPYIVGNEAAERFSFYGMSTILFQYLVALFVLKGVQQGLAESQATEIKHLFNAGTYAMPMIGAILADRLLGKYPTILWMSLLYCVGHGILAMFPGNLTVTYVGLACIALGAGGIKPCVSAHVGDQYGKGNWHLVDKAIQMFYWCINFGAFFSTAFIPAIKDRWGYGVAFAIPGVLMGIATFVFWLGRHKFVHVPPSPGGRLGLLDTLSAALLFMSVGQLFFTASSSWSVRIGVGLACLTVGLVLFGIRQSIQQDDGFLAVSLHAIRTRFTGGMTTTAKFGVEAVEGVLAVLRIMVVFCTVIIFFSLYFQYESSWIRQGKMMVRPGWHIPFIGGLTEESIQSFNPALIMLFIPLITFLRGKIKKAGRNASALRVMSIGMFIMIADFVVVALIQGRIDELAIHGQKLNLLWQAYQYIIAAIAEAMVVAIGLEFAYTQAPPRMKSTVMGFLMLSISLGNLLVAVMARIGPQKLEHSFWAFAGLMAVAAVIFAVIAYFYKVRDYTQGAKEEAKEV